MSKVNIIALSVGKISLFGCADREASVNSFKSIHESIIQTASHVYDPIRFNKLCDFADKTVRSTSHGQWTFSNAYGIPCEIHCKNVKQKEKIIINIYIDE